MNHRQGDDLDLKHLLRVIFVQGGQVAIGTAIGAGVLLLVGIVGVLLAPLLVPIFLYRYWRSEKAAAAAAAEARAADAPPPDPPGGTAHGQDVSDLSGGGVGAPPPV